LSEHAIAQGLDPSTPAVAVANATRPNEAMIAATVGTIAEKIEASALDGPVLVMIGRVLASAIAQESSSDESSAHDALRSA
jgi:uroporphyrin-III C-methyltransferase/precorrin-2 dehydrogenase/sirohydrochlorin ferrochelatase